jgi:inhibitor of cysteine peptidase
MDKNLKIAVSVWAFVIVALLMYVSIVNKQIDRINKGITQTEEKKDLNKFKSAEDFVRTIENINRENSRGYGGVMKEAMPQGTSTSSGLPNPMSLNASDSSGSEESSDFSQTNVQVQGVDEADIVKTDGNYIYTASRNYITVTKAVPADGAEFISKIDLKNSTPQEIFVDGNKLMVFGSRSYGYYEPQIESSAKSMPSREYYYGYSNLSFVELYDISDKANPQLKKKLEFEGSYKSSRKIGTDVYFILNTYPSYYYNQTDDSSLSAEEKCQNMVPQYREGVDINESSKMRPVASCTDINYVEPVEYVQYAEVIGVSMDDENKPFSREVILGAGDNVYASPNNVYLARNMYTSFRRPSRGPMGMFAPEYDYREDVKILKFKIEKGQVAFDKAGTVPGRVLNQFSMDEFEDHFRIATTNQSQNNVYVLDSSLKRSGSIENIAPGEQIHSARFMGKRGFLVTFKKIDPFFTMDLSDPNNPKIIGKLKIPGYSDYLHPYDENHIIGIGKNTAEASNDLSGVSNFAWYQGIKMAMFDITDFANPKEMFKIDIGDRGTDSPILTDHKALLFSKEKDLLVIPIMEAKLTEAQKNNSKKTGSEYGQYVYQGAYVFKLNLDDGFSLQGRITHFPDDYSFQKSGYYYGNNDYSVKRSLYIGENLYTISDGKIQINKLSDLEKVKEVSFDLPSLPQQPVYYNE